MIVYSNPYLLMVSHLKNILENNGISCEIRGEYALLGERAAHDCWPELWIADESQFEKAKQIISEAMDSSEIELKSWKCPSCQEEIEEQFTECWKCGARRPEPI